MKLVDAVEEFIVAKQADGRAPRTIEDYRRVLLPFASWCKERDIADIASLNRNHIRNYVAHLRQKGWAEGTVAIHIRNLRTFLRWCHLEDLHPENLALAVKAPRTRPREETLPTPEELTLFLQACKGEDLLSKRDLALALTLLDTGLRVGELVLLTVDAVSLDGRGSHIKVYAPKTKNWRYVFLGSVATAALQAYLAERMKKRRPCWGEALFVGLRGPLTEQGVYKALRRRAEEAGLPPEKFHPHIWRKMFATFWLEGGGDTVRLKRIGGWRTEAMLEVYVVTAERRDLAEAHRRFGPVDRLAEALGLELDIEGN